MDYVYILGALAIPRLSEISFALVNLVEAVEGVDPSQRRGEAVTSLATARMDLVETEMPRLAAISSVEDRYVVHSAVCTAGASRRRWRRMGLRGMAGRGGPVQEEDRAGRHDEACAAASLAMGCKLAAVRCRVTRGKNVDKEEALSVVGIQRRKKSIDFEKTT